MLNQDVLLNSHEVGVGGLESEILNGFVSLCGRCGFGHRSQ